MIIYSIAIEEQNSWVIVRKIVYKSAKIAHCGNKSLIKQAYHSGKQYGSWILNFHFDLAKQDDTVIIYNIFNSIL